MEGTEPTWRHAFICAMYESVGSRSRMLRAHLDADTEDDTIERTHLTRAADLLESAELEIGRLLTEEARASLPGDGYGTYLDDEIGAVLMRIKDYGQILVGVASGMHAYEAELTDSECADARTAEGLVTRAFRVLAE